MAALQTALFVAMFICAGAAGYLIIRQAELVSVDAEIAKEVDDLVDVQARGGLPALVAVITARQRDPSLWEFRLEDAQHRRLAGDLPAHAYADGWSTLRLVEGDKPNGESEVVRSRTRDFSGGVRMTIGEDLGARRQADNAVMAAIAAVALLVAGVGLGVGAWVSQRVLQRLDRMADAVNRYTGGETSVRIPASDRAHSDLDDLALVLNRMMDRTTILVEGIRQISTDIAHDLRRPLAHHNQDIARVLSAPRSAEAYRAALTQASGQVDEVLATFQALLQITELEAGAPGLELRPVDLSEIAARIVEAYAPMAEEGGRSVTLLTPVDQPVLVLGESRLIARLLANIVENALVHTRAGTKVCVLIDPLCSAVNVSDDGQGIPADSRERIFRRFVRLEESRSSPGSGLGLAVASAITTACRATIVAEDADPGVRFVVRFEAAH